MSAFRTEAKLWFVPPHIVRFLKTPKVQVENGSVHLKAAITVTTDLGETFYPDTLDLVATIRSVNEDGDIYLRRRLQYPARTRSLPISFNLTLQDVDWPACMHVATREVYGGRRRQVGHEESASPLR